MKKTIITLILIITPTTLLAEDRWYLGAGYGNYNIFSTDSVNHQDIADNMFNLYLTHGNNLDYTYRVGLRDRSLYRNESGLATSSQTLLATDIIYNLISSKSGLFFDIEIGITTPVSTTSFLQGTDTIDGQKDLGAHIGVGIGFTFKRSYTIRAHAYQDYSSTQFTNGVDSSIDPQIASGLELIYSW
ncbi:MAG: hypothetical protein OEY11_13695 [Gammaproteobacteria bacterium]|nr:hypothetical protein [Gammaproteobacteria bacterium]